MAWSVDLDDKFGLIHIIYSGTVTKKDVEAATEECFSFIEGPGPHKFLVELDNVTLQMSTVEVFGVSNQWDELGFSRMNKNAIIVSEDEKIMDSVRLYVVTCRSHGWRVSMFHNQKDAIEWLVDT